MTLPRCVDLSRVAEIAEGDPRYHRLATTIRRALTVQSCAADLAQVTSIVKAWDKLSDSARGAGSEERAGTEAALLFSGVSLYVRATFSSTGKGDRGSINIEAALGAEEKVDHAALVAVRNQVFAHVFPDRAIAGDIWHENLCMAIEQDGGWRIGGATRNTWNHGPIWNALRRQAPIASAILRARFRKKADEIATSLNEEGISSALLLKGLFDPADFFGSEQHAASMMPDQIGRAFITRPASGGQSS